MADSGFWKPEYRPFHHLRVELFQGQGWVKNVNISRYDSMNKIECVNSKLVEELSRDL